MFKFKKTDIPKIAKPKNKNKTILLGSIVVGFLAMGGMYSAVMAFISPVNVVVAVHDIDTMRKITAADVTEKQIASRDFHPLAYNNVKSVIGSYPKMPISQGEPILSSKLVNNPDKIIDTFETLQPDEMILELKEGKNISFPKILKKGDYITVYSVEKDGVKEYAKGSKYLSSGGPNIISNLDNLSSGDDPNNGKVVIICKKEEGKKILRASKEATLLYITQEHPDNLIITPGKNVATPKS